MSVISVAGCGGCVVVQWDEENPGAGDLSGLIRIEGFLRVAADRVLGLHEGVRSVNQNITADIWQGEGRKAWGDRLDDRRRSMEPLPEAFVGAADAIKVYRGAVAEINRVVDDHEDNIGQVADAALGVGWMSEGGRGPCDHLRRFEVDSFAIEAELTGDNHGRAPWVLHNLSGRQPGHGVRSVDDAYAWTAYVNAEISAQAQGVHGQGEVRRAADSQLRDGLRGVMPQTWPAERAAFVARGVSDPRQMVGPHTDGYASAFEVFLSKAAAVNAAAVATELSRTDLGAKERIALMDQWQELMAGREGDLVFWTMFFAQFPPEKLPALIELQLPTVQEAELSSQHLSMGDQAMETFTTVQDGLALYANSLSAEAQAELGSKMTMAAAELNDEGGGYVLNYLMSDPRLPDGVYAGAMVALDQLERVEDFEWKAFGYNDDQALVFGGKQSLASVSHDPALPVMEGIARGETTALDFFNPHGDSTTGEARLTYWVGERDYGDGLEAMTSAVSAATSAEVNLDPQDGTHRDERSAQTISLATELLAKRDDLNTLNEQAAVNLATAYAPYMGDIDRYRGFDYLTDMPMDQRWDSGHITEQEIGPDRTWAKLDTGAVTDIIAATGRHEAAAAQWSAQAAEFRNTAFALALDPAVKTSDRRMAIEEGMSGEGLVLGSLARADMEAAQEADEAADKTWTLATTMASLTKVGAYPMAVLAIGMSASGIDITQAHQQAIDEAQNRDDVFYARSAYALAQEGLAAGYVIPIDPNASAADNERAINDWISPLIEANGGAMGNTGLRDLNGAQFNAAYDAAATGDSTLYQERPYDETIDGKDS